MAQQPERDFLSFFFFLLHIESCPFAAAASSVVPCVGVAKASGFLVSREAALHGQHICWESTMLGGGTWEFKALVSRELARVTGAKGIIFHL